MKSILYRTGFSLQRLTDIISQPNSGMANLDEYAAFDETTSTAACSRADNDGTESSGERRSNDTGFVMAEYSTQ